MRERIGQFDTRLRNWRLEREDIVRLMEAIADARRLLPALLRRAEAEAFRPEDMDDVIELYRRLAMRQPGGRTDGLPPPTAAPLLTVDTIRRSELRDHALSSDAAWASLTEAERGFLEADLAQELKRPHQMFGIGADIQGYGQVEGPDTFLLFQAFHDEPMMWIFGDMGTVQFRIRRDDLVARRWEGAWVDITSG